MSAGRVALAPERRAHRDHKDFGPAVVLSILASALIHGYRSPRMPGRAGHMGNVG